MTGSAAVRASARSVSANCEAVHLRHLDVGDDDVEGARRP